MPKDQRQMGPSQQYGNYPADDYSRGPYDQQQPMQGGRPLPRQGPRDPYRDMHGPPPPHDRRDPRDMRGDPRDYRDDRYREYGRGRPGEHPRIFVAMFDYDPQTMSPNPDACDEELGFREGQLIKVFGDKDADGFYWGESGGLSGYVPYNMVSEVQVRLY